MQNFTSLMGMGAIFGIILGLWNQIKAGLWKFLNLFIEQVTIDSTSETSNPAVCNMALIRYLLLNCKRSPYYDKVISVESAPLKIDGKYVYMGVEKFGVNTVVFWKGKVPIIYGNYTKNTGGTNTEKVTTITFIRKTLNFDELFKEAINDFNHMLDDHFNDKAKSFKRFFIKNIPYDEADVSAAISTGGTPWYIRKNDRLITHNVSDIGPNTLNSKLSPLQRLIFPEKTKKLIEEIVLWRTNQKWYENRGIPWKRGWLLYGVPGTGKTALARAFAEELDLPIFVYNLAGMTNYEFVKTWNNMLKYSPCIALIEDIDNVFHGRENISGSYGMSSFFSIMDLKKTDKKDNNVSKEEKDEHTKMARGYLTFDTLLSSLDGIQKASGVFTIITTNNLDHIDEALGKPRVLENGEVEFISTRPGRIDKAIELTYLDEEGMMEMADKILGMYPDEMEKLNQFLIENPNLKETPAQFQERCSQIALDKFWKEKSNNQFKTNGKHKKELTKCP